MPKAPFITCYKNAICASVGLLIVFTTSIFVAKDFFGDQISDLIDQASILKDYRYADWGQYPGNIDAQYTYTLSLYDQKTGSASAKTDPQVLKHSFKYKDISFGQGNQGFIRFRHQWQLNPTGKLDERMVSTINLPAERIYTYERLATPARRFAILYNTLWSTVQQQLLPFFTAQLHGFYFQNRRTVQNAVFAEVGLSATTMDAIYNNQVFGWGKKETFQPWVLLAHQKNRKDLKEYELIQEAVGISAAELDRLVGEHSMMNTLSTALNGTIKLILENPRGYSFKKCVPFCSDKQLVAFELLTGALTAKPVFLNVNMRSSLKDLNATLPDDIQIATFCPECPLDQNSMNFLIAGYLGNFTTLTKVFKNLTDIDNIQKLFNLPDPSYAANFLSYMDYLQKSIFTPTNPTTQEVDTEAYEFMVNNHLFINGAVNSLKDVLNIELHTRAMMQLLANGEIACEDFFTGDYSPFVGLCQKEEFNPTKISSMRTYVRAFFFQNRDSFVQKTSMTLTQASNFLRLDPQSLFAAKMKQIRTTLSTELGCSTTFCSEEELLTMEWSGMKDVLSRLPKDLFPNPPASITEWDVDNRLGRVQPQYFKVTGDKLSTEQGKLLLGSGPESILVLFNLLSLKTQCDAGDINAVKLVNYVQKVAFDVYFGGAMTTRPISQVIMGFEPIALKEKIGKEDLLGGASWLSANAQLISTKHSPDTFNKINTGIYDRSRLRTMMEVDQSLLLGSKLVLFRSQYQQVTEFLSSEREVFGTNLLGFHPDISSTENLAVLLDFAYQGVILVPGPSQSTNGVDGIRYSLKPVPTAYIGFNEQNERSVTINPESYFVIDPITGNTLRFSVKYTVSSPAPFLKYYPGASTAERPIFDCEVYYSREDVSSISDIVDMKEGLRMVYIVTIVLASLSMISIVVFAVLLRIKSKSGARKELNDTMISSEGSSIIGSEGKSSIKV